MTLKADLFSRAAAALLCLPGMAAAQLPSLKSSNEKAEAGAPAAETAEQARKRLTALLAEWRARTQALANAAPPPAGITDEELAAHRADLLLGAFASENTLRSLDTAVILDQSARQAKERNTAWTGFEAPGPYSFIQHDEFRRQQEGIATRISAYNSAVSMTERELAARQDDIRKAGESVRRAQETADRAAPAEVDAAVWRLEAAKLRLKALGAAAGMLQQSRDNTWLRITGANSEAELLKRKVAALGTITAFPEEDLERLKKSTEERRRDVAAILTGIEKAQHAAIAARQKTLAGIEPLKARGTEATAEEKARLEQGENRVRFLDNELESMSNRSEITGARLRFLTEYQDAQMSRKTLLTSDSGVERTEALAALQTQLARASAFDSLVDVRRNATLSAIQEQEVRLADRPRPHHGLQVRHRRGGLAGGRPDQCDHGLSRRHLRPPAHPHGGRFQVSDRSGAAEALPAAVFVSVAVISTRLSSAATPATLQGSPGR